MNYPRRTLDPREYYRNRRVYVKDLDVFGRISNDLKFVVCEAPLTEYRYAIDAETVLYHEAIGDRDPVDQPLIPITICDKPECNYPCCNCALSYAPADQLLMPEDEAIDDLFDRSDWPPRD